MTALPTALIRPFEKLLHAVVLLLAGLAVSPAAAANATIDSDVPAPPGRVGQISLLSGPVTLTDTQTSEQQPAALNWPLTSGMQLTTGGWGRAEVRIGSLTLRLDGDSEIDFIRIDDELIQLVIRRGSVALRARTRDLLPEIDLTTLRERITLGDAGRYRVDVDRAAGITALTVFAGAARIAANRLVFDVRSGQRGEFSTLPNTGFAIQPAGRDAFDDWVASRERRDDALASSRYVSPEMTGIESLDEHGSWRTVPDYGTVWFPRVVVSGWVPYRYGRWGWVSPWGWTWIDDAPWGFAPFHYGRWVVVSGAWCWVPGAWVARPVYAPALVAWVGSPGVSVGLGSVGWFPLGPREIFIPAYRHPSRYVDRINLPHVPQVHGRPVVQPPPVYVNQTPRASTWVPAEAIGRHEPIRHQLVPGPADPGRWVARPVPPPSVVSPARPSPAAPAVPAPPAPRDGTLRPLPPIAPPPAMPASPLPEHRMPDRPAVSVPRMMPPAAGRPGDDRAPPTRIDSPRADTPRPPASTPPTPPAQPMSPGPGNVSPPAAIPPTMPRHDHVAPPPRVMPPRPPQGVPAPAPEAQRAPSGPATDTAPGVRREPPRREPRGESRSEGRGDGRVEGRGEGRGEGRAEPRSEGVRAMRL